MITTVVFDIGRVLIGFDWDDYVSNLFDDETAEKVTKAVFGSKWWHELDRAVISKEQIVENFYSIEPEYKAEIDEAFERVGECVKKRDWVIPLIEELKGRGYRVLYLSNMSTHVIDSNPEAFAFTEHMDGGVYSHRAHAIKPGTEIYGKLFEKYDISPEECLFIDDSPANVAQAKRLGMKAILYEGREQLENDLDQALTKHIRHERISVMCYGDSNTYGYDPCTGSRIPFERRWTSILARKLGDGYDVIPEGLNGRTTAYDRPGAGWKNGATSFLSCFATHKPVDYIVIMLGTNDCLNTMGLSPEQIAKGMENLVDLANENAPEIQGYIPQMVIVAPPAIGEDYMDSPFEWELDDDSLKKSRELAPLYRDIAERHRCLFVDATGCVELSQDCLHLNERGHEQIGGLLFEAIAQTYD